MNNKTIEVLDRVKCTGCGSCFNKCPVGAIKMKDNGEGFLYPSIDFDVCIECGLCKKHCPELNTDKIDAYRAKSPECYGRMASQDIRKSSSSGGMFTILAPDVLLIFTL